MNGFRDLLVWQKGMELVSKVYKLQESFPKEEQYALSSQIRRSAISIPSNIAEGYGRHHKQDFARFLEIARSSLYELQTQLEIVKNVGYLTDGELSQVIVVCHDLEKMLNSFIKTISEKK